MSQLLAEWRSQSAQAFIPLQASLELTNRCNERCTHCYIPEFKDDPSRVLTIEQWKKILQELRSAGSLYLILMGGEAMLNPLFWPILEHAAGLGFHVSMISNGLKINSSTQAQGLKDSGLHQVTMSYYSLDDTVQDRMTRVKGSGPRTRQAIEFCLEVDLSVSVNCLLTKDNIDGVFDLYDWCVERRIDMKVDPNVTAKLDGNLDPTELRATEEKLQWFYQERTRRWPNSRPQSFQDESEDHVCNAAKGKCAVTAYGELLPCIEIREPLGSLVSESFTEIWSRPEAEKWRGLRNADLKDWKPGFCEHCPGMSKNELGDPLQVSKFSKLLEKIRREQNQCRTT